MSGTSAYTHDGAAPFGPWLGHAGKSGQRSKVPKPFDAITEAAFGGDAAAQLLLATHYLHGRSVPQSDQAAADWFKLAAANRNVDAMLQLSRMAMAGSLPASRAPALFRKSGHRVQEPCFDQARLWAQRAVAAGSEEGRVLLAVILAHGSAERQDEVATRALLDHAMAAGSPTATFVLAIQHAQQRSAEPVAIASLLRNAVVLPAAAYLYGVATETGCGCERDPVAATALYRYAAGQGFVWAQARLGRALVQGPATVRNQFEGVTWLKMAARAGNSHAAALLGDFYARVSEETNYFEAGHWFLRAAELGDASSARIASMLHLTGTGLPAERKDVALCLRRAETLAFTIATRDPDPAQLIAGDRADLCATIDVRAWFAPLAGSGDPLAAYRFGVCLAMGIGGRTDLARAAESLRHATATIPAAQLLYGQILLAESSPHPDAVEGRAWVQRAALAGLPEARIAWAELLANGRGGQQDSAMALHLLTEAALQGHPGAMYAVGAVHGGGHGVAPDRRLAQRWFRKAAEAGHGRAQLMLGRYLAHGLAGEQDRAASGTWLRRAIENGIGEARQDLAALVEIG